MVGLQLTVQLSEVTLPAWSFYWGMEPTWRLKTMFVSPPTFSIIQTFFIIYIFIVNIILLELIGFKHNLCIHCIMKDGKTFSMLAKDMGMGTCVVFLEVRCMSLTANGWWLHSHCLLHCYMFVMIPLSLYMWMDAICTESGSFAAGELHII